MSYSRVALRQIAEYEEFEGEPLPFTDEEWLSFSHGCVEVKE